MVWNAFHGPTHPIPGQRVPLTAKNIVTTEHQPANTRTWRSLDTKQALYHQGTEMQSMLVGSDNGLEKGRAHGCDFQTRISYFDQGAHGYVFLFFFFFTFTLFWSRNPWLPSLCKSYFDQGTHDCVPCAHTSYFDHLQWCCNLHVTANNAIVLRLRWTFPY